MTPETALALAPDMAPELSGRHNSALAEHLARLTDHCIRMRFKRNEVLAKEGEAITQIHKIQSGCVRLCHRFPDGRRPIADFMFAGDILGLSTASTYALAAEAVTPITVLAYSRTQFNRFTEGNGRVRTEIMSHLTQALSRTQEHLFLLNCLGARERMAAFLLRLYRHGQFVYGDRIDLPMGRQDLADYLGLTVETVCRALAYLRRQAVIETRNAQLVVIKDLPRLIAAAEGRELSV